MRAGGTVVQVTQTISVTLPDGAKTAPQRKLSPPALRRGDE